MNSFFIMLFLRLLLLASFTGFIICSSIGSEISNISSSGSSSSSSSSSDGTIESSNHSIDQNLKNLRIIESKYIPDISDISEDTLQYTNTDNWQQVRHFMENGLPVLGLYGYKIQKGIFN